MGQNLEERLLNYSERIFRLAESVKYGDNLTVLSKQLLRSATSVGANYAESMEAFYPKERLHRLVICRKELRESFYWLELIAKVRPNLNLSLLIEETIQLRAILTTMIVRLQKTVKVT